MKNEIDLVEIEQLAIDTYLEENEDESWALVDKVCELFGLDLDEDNDEVREHLDEEIIKTKAFKIIFDQLVADAAEK